MVESKSLYTNNMYPIHVYCTRHTCAIIQKHIILLFIFFMECFLTFILYMLYEQMGGAVYIFDSGASTFISCSWNGNSAPSGYVSDMFQTFSLLQQFHE